MSTSGLMAEVSPISSEFLYPPLQILGNPVTSSICCSMVIARSTVDIARDQLVYIGRDQWWLVEAIKIGVVVLDGD